ncbi:MAG: DNA-processing protein DprA [Phycisphaerae bacterium]|nr:DNA-processing protein DprA [Phycisphaerae bacterium]
MQTNSSQIEKWIKLIRADGVGPKTFSRLLKYFGSVDSALAASMSQLAKIEGIGYKTAERISATRNSFDAGGELELAEKLGIWIVNIEDSRYPALLKAIYDPPPVLYIKGTLSKDDNLCAAIVGSRQCSIYGREQASMFAHLLAAGGFTICSGMARGIDSAAHQGAISAGGRTLAVMGCGLANIFPAENKKLFELIANNGACISELPLRTEPRPENFPPRNRIIAGLSLATIVIEANLRSGALITAQQALENNRDVMAVPGRIDSPLNKGSHLLLKQGARLIESVEDIMDALGYIGDQIGGIISDSAEKTAERVEMPLFDVNKLKLSSEEKVIYDCLSKNPKHKDVIISESDLSPGSINAGLISLRLKGLIKELPGSAYIKK